MRAGASSAQHSRQTVDLAADVIWHRRCDGRTAEGMTVSVTVAPGTTSVTIVCAWCRREAGDASSDPRAIVGLCDTHVSGFVSRVDTLLGSLAELRGRRTRGQEAPVSAPSEPDGQERVADLLRTHTGLTLCDACIAADLGWPAPRVADEAGRLDAAEFVRDPWRCGRCGARGVVTRARSRRTRLVETQAA
jgi:hypothetical protein